MVSNASGYVEVTVVKGIVSTEDIPASPRMIWNNPGEVIQETSTLTQFLLASANLEDEISFKGGSL